MNNAKLLIMPQPEAAKVEQDRELYRKIVAKYRAAQRRRSAFRQIVYTIYFAAITSAALIYVLRACGLY